MSNLVGSILGVQLGAMIAFGPGTLRFVVKVWLHIAVTVIDRDAEVVRTLLAYRANVLALDSSGLSPLQIYKGVQKPGHLTKS